MKYKKSWQIALLVALAIEVNYMGKLTALHFNLPIWGDSLGTVLIAYLYGPVAGAIVGLSSNLLHGYMNQASFFYGLTSIATGLLAGYAAGKKCFEHFFDAISLGVVLAVLGVVVSTPLNMLTNNGMTGNLWGDGIVNLLLENHLPGFIASGIGEFYVDFPDRILIMIITFFMVKMSRKMADSQDGFHTRKLLSLLLVVTLLTGMGAQALAAPSEASDEETEEAYEASVDPAHIDNHFYDYIQTIYDGANGIPGTTVNDITSTGDGILWIGSYGGLYRYNGSEFKWMDGFESVKNVNCFYRDTDGRLWIGTNDGGLSVCINEEISGSIDTSAGLPNDSIQTITEDSDNMYYVGTSDSVALVSLDGGLHVEGTIDEIKYAKSSTADENGHVAMVSDEGVLYLLNNKKILDSLDKASETTQFNSCAIHSDGKLYAGTSSHEIVIFDISEDKLTETGRIDCLDLENIQSMKEQKDGIMFICSDTGVGYLDEEGAFRKINSNAFDSSIDNMDMDYQGNIWFTSSRQGLLKLSKSPFTEMFESAGLASAVVNGETKWNGRMYYATDNGICITDENDQAVTNDPLLEMFSSIRIRSVKVDSQNRLWACTSGSGFYCVNPDGSSSHYTSNEGTLGDKFRSIVELEDGTIVAGGDSGITYLKDGQVIDTVGRDQGMSNSKVLSLELCKDQSLLAGTDGGGIIRISSDHKVTKSYDKSNSAISSNIVMRTVANKSGDGHFIVSGNGLCYLDENDNVKILDNFPYYNDFDVIDLGSDSIFVLCSAGIYVVNKDDLLAGKKLDYELLDARRGLRGSLTANAWNYVDDNGDIYLACDSGASRVNANDYDNNGGSYRIMVKTIGVDGENRNVDKNDINSIERGATKVEIYPEVVNYSSNDPYVSYYLEGVDQSKTVVHQSELSSVVYTNLAMGTYKFHLAVLDSKGKEEVEESIYSFHKEGEIYDNSWFGLYIGLIIVLLVTWLTWFFTRMQTQRTVEEQKKQLKLANETILAIARTVDAKDPYTSQHSKRVSEYSVLIAQQLGYDAHEVEEIRNIALLHDIGKISIPDRILNKPGKLTDDEYKIMKSHVSAGGEILKDFTLIDNVAEGALYHHERYDGKGYVYGLKGEDIPLNARIIGISDAFDAMTANRVYRQKLDFSFVVEELKRCSGSQFDPKLVDIMLKLIEDGKIDIEALYGPLEKNNDEKEEQ